MEGTPTTCVLTYRGVRGYTNGLHKGARRDVLITGADIPGEPSPLLTIASLLSGVPLPEWLSRGTNLVPRAVADASYKGAEFEMGVLAPNMDQALVYLGARGASAGFESIERILSDRPGSTIRLVACDCARPTKERFAQERNLPVTWAECGGRATLGRLVTELLS